MKNSGKSCVLKPSYRYICHFPFSFMSPTADELAAQKKQAEEQKRAADKMIADQKALLRNQIADYDKQMASIRTLRSKAASDLSKLG